MEADYDAWARHHELLDAVERMRPEPWHDMVIRRVVYGYLVGVGICSALWLAKILGVNW